MKTARPCPRRPSTRTSMISLIIPIFIIIIIIRVMPSHPNLKLDPSHSIIVVNPRPDPFPFPTLAALSELHEVLAWLLVSPLTLFLCHTRTSYSLILPLPILGSSSSFNLLSTTATTSTSQRTPRTPRFYISLRAPVHSFSKTFLLALVPRRLLYIISLTFPSPETKVQPRQNPGLTHVITIRGPFFLSPHRRSSSKAP